jgi:thymidylate synthase
MVKEIITHEQFAAPKLVVDPDVKNFYDFTVDSFKLVDYKYNDKKYDIPVAE